MGRGQTPNMHGKTSLRMRDNIPLPVSLSVLVDDEQIRTAQDEDEVFVHGQLRCSCNS